MPLFRRKTASSLLPRTSSISVYGQGRAQALQMAHKAERGASFSSIDLDDRPHPLVFAEATFDPGLPIKTKSRLSKDLSEILHDNAALAYFIQYMDAKSTKHLVKFWLEAESFRISAEIKAKEEVRHGDPCTVIPDVNVCAAASRGSSGYLSADETLPPNSSQVKQKPGDGCEPNLSAGPSSGDGTTAKVRKASHQSSSADSGCEEARSKEEDSPLPTMALEEEEDPFTAKGDALPASAAKCEMPDTRKERVTRLETSMQQDADAIYLKYISPEASHPIGIPDELRTRIKDSVFNPSGKIDSLCFLPAQEFVVKRMDKEFYPNFLRSSFHCKHQIDVLTSGTVFLADVLYNDSALFFFMEYMEQEKVRHLVDFLLTADNFRKHLTTQKQQDIYDGLQAQADAMVLYDKYFSLQATTPLGFSDAVRFELEANICQEAGPEPDCFSKPVRILTQYLEKTYLLQFLNSQLYFKYISECIIIIQNEGSDSGSLKRSIGTGSDSGSEQSLPISSINTLLAMDSGKQPGGGGASRFSNRGSEHQSYRVDPFQIKSDEIWQRPASGRLQMAHVDHLGRVTTEFEIPDSDKKKGESKISKAMKKLVNWEEDKNQEEMAWKVAEMIVKDICSVTMPECKYPVTPQKTQSLQPST